MLLRKSKPIQLWKYGLPAEKHTSQNNMFQAVPFIKNNKNIDFILCKLSYFSCFLFGALYLCPIKKYIDRGKGLNRQYLVYRPRPPPPSAGDSPTIKFLSTPGVTCSLGPV